MKGMKIKETVVKTGYKIFTFGKKHLPEELAIAGCVFVGGTAFFAYKAARKKDDILEEVNDEIEDLHNEKEYYEAAIEEDIEEPADFFIKEYKKTLTKLYIKKGGKIVVLFLPVIGCGVGAVACFLGAQHVLNVRNAALTSAIGALSTKFDDYRDRVRDEVGEEKEFDIYHGIKHEKETVVSEKEDGTKKHEKVDSKVVRNENASTKIFKNGDRGFVADLDLDETQIRAYMQWAKQRCGNKGHIQISEIDEQFGWDEDPDDIVMGYTNPDDIDWKLERVRIPVSDPISGRETLTDGILVDFGKTVNVWKSI